MDPRTYDAWYDSPRGRWIGGVEYALLESLLASEPGASLLDVGCGTGHFTRRFARSLRGEVAGLDPDRARIAYARGRAAHGERYVAGRAESLPFADRSFDYAISVTALCFVAREEQALRELVRVARRRIVLGLLNRGSLLHRQKAGSGGYRGAHWHTAAEVRALFAPLPVSRLRLRSAVVLPGGGALARAVECCWPRRLLLGGFLAVAADIDARAGTR